MLQIFVWGTALVGFLVVIGNPGGGLNGLAVAGQRIAVFIIMLALIYQSFDSFRAGWFGINSATSKAVENPEASSNRFGAFAWGAICAAIASLIMYALIFRVGPWANYYGGDQRSRGRGV